MTEVKKYGSAGAAMTHYGVVNTDGYMIGSTGVLPTAGNADGAGVAQLEHVKTFPFQPREPERLTQTGDDGAAFSMLFKPIELPGGPVTFGAADLDFEARVQGSKVKAYGNIAVGLMQPETPTYPDIGWIVQSRAIASISGASIVAGLMVCRTNVVPLHRDSFAERAFGNFMYTLSANKTNKLLWGEAIGYADYNDTKAVGFPFTAPNWVDMRVFVGNGTATEFNLPYAPFSEDGDHCIVAVNGTLLTYTTGYTLSIATKKITFTSPPALNAIVEVFYVRAAA